MLLLSSLATLAGLAILCHFVSLLAPITLLGGAIAIVARSCRSPRTRIVHDFFPVIAIIVIYELLGPIIPVVNPARWDGTFAALDARLFGQLPSVWFGALGRPAWLTDLASVAYVLYYLLPVVLGVRLYAGDRDEFHAFAFAIVAAFLVSYAGYLLFPTLGPRSPGDSVLGGGAVTRGVLGFVRTVEGNPLDAFPSGHVAIALVCVGRGWQLFPRWRAPLALVLAGIGFSTVYLSYHYVIDVVAGVALGTALLVVLQRGRESPSAARRRGTVIDQPAAALFSDRSGTR